MMPPVTSRVTLMASPVRSRDVARDVTRVTGEATREVTREVTGVLFSDPPKGGAAEHEQRQGHDPGTRARKTQSPPLPGRERASCRAHAMRRCAGRPRCAVVRAVYLMRLFTVARTPGGTAASPPKKVALPILALLTVSARSTSRETCWSPEPPSRAIADHRGRAPELDQSPLSYCRAPRYQQT